MWSILVWVSFVGLSWLSLNSIDGRWMLSYNVVIFCYIRTSTWGRPTSFMLWAFPELSSVRETVSFDLVIAFSRMIVGSFNLWILSGYRIPDSKTSVGTSNVTVVLIHRTEGCRTRHRSVGIITEQRFDQCGIWKLNVKFGIICYDDALFRFIWVYGIRST